MIDNGYFAAAHVMLDSERTVTIRNVQDAVCSFYSIPRNALLAHTRNRKVSRMRLIGYMLSREFSLQPYTVIGRQFNGRDHTTIMSGIKRIEAASAKDPEVARDVETIRLMLTNYCP